MSKEENIKRIKKLQGIQLEILKYFDKVARENNITYYLGFGSLLGAVRHQGFIPWDVDIDITLMRDDYERVIKILRGKEKDTPFFVRYPGEKNHTSPHALLYLQDTAVFWKNEKLNKHNKKPREIYIDLFPIDYLHDDLKIRKKHIKRLAKFRNALQIKTPIFHKESKVYTFLKWIRSLKYLYISNEKLQTKCNKEMIRYNENKGKFLGQFSSSHYKTFAVEKGVYGKPIYVKFEDMMAPIPADYDAFLKQVRVYGDYTKLPSKEKQEQFFKAEFEVFDYRRKADERPI